MSASSINYFDDDTIGDKHSTSNGSMLKNEKNSMALYIGAYEALF